MHRLVVCFQTIGSPLPEFELWPRTFSDRVTSALGGQDIRFEGSPDFSAQYRLRARDEPAVRRVFRPEVLRFFIGEDGILLPWTQGWHAEARDGWLIVYRPHHIADAVPQALPDFLRKTQELFDLVTARR